MRDAVKIAKRSGRLGPLSYNLNALRGNDYGPDSLRPCVVVTEDKPQKNIKKKER